MPADGFEITAASVQEGYIFVRSQFGDHRKLAVYDLDGKLISKVRAPGCCSISGQKWEVPGKRLLITLESDVADAREFAYDVQSRRFEDPDIESKMLQIGEMRFVSRIIHVTSKDGQKIPVRLTYAKDLNRDGANPAIINVYGGFRESTFFNPTYDTMQTQFLLHGGILVRPALRGGGEFGKSWWDAGRGLNRKTRFTM